MLEQDQLTLYLSVFPYVLGISYLCFYGVLNLFRFICAEYMKVQRAVVAVPELVSELRTMNQKTNVVSNHLHNMSLDLNRMGHTDKDNDLITLLPQYVQMFRNVYEIFNPPNLIPNSVHNIKNYDKGSYYDESESESESDPGMYCQCDYSVPPQNQPPVQNQPTVQTQNSGMPTGTEIMEQIALPLFKMALENYLDNSSSSGAMPTFQSEQVPNNRTNPFDSSEDESSNGNGNEDSNENKDSDENEDSDKTGSMGSLEMVD